MRGTRHVWPIQFCTARSNLSCMYVNMCMDKNVSIYTHTCACMYVCVCLCICHAYTRFFKISMFLYQRHEFATFFKRLAHTLTKGSGQYVLVGVQHCKNH